MSGQATLSGGSIEKYSQLVPEQITDGVKSDVGAQHSLFTGT